MAWPLPPVRAVALLDPEAPLEEQRAEFARCAAWLDEAGLLKRYVGEPGQCPVLNAVIEATDTLAISGPGLAAWVERQRERAKRGVPIWD